MKIFTLTTTLLLSMSASMSVLADSDVYDLLSGKNVYARVKKDSIEANEDVFLKYEKQKSRKVIAGCIRSGVTYSVQAQWDLKISSKRDAENAAQKLCTESGAFGGVLLGYKVKTEIRF